MREDLPVSFGLIDLLYKTLVLPNNINIIFDVTRISQLIKLNLQITVYKMILMLTRYYYVKKKNIYTRLSNFLT